MPTPLKGAGWRSAKPNAPSKSPKPHPAEVPDEIVGVTPRGRSRRNLDEKADGDASKCDNEGISEAQRGGQLPNIVPRDENRRKNIRDDGNNSNNNDSNNNNHDTRAGKTNKRNERCPSVVTSRKGDHDGRVKENGSGNNKNNDNSNGVGDAKMPSLPRNGKGISLGYCKKVYAGIDGSSQPRVPRYGVFSNLLPESYKMAWRQVGLLFFVFYFCALCIEHV